MTTRPRAADDFDFIGKKLRELQSQKLQQPLDVEGLLSKKEAWSLEDRKAVANFYNCEWEDSNMRGCGRNATRDCLRVKTCVHRKVK